MSDDVEVTPELLGTLERLAADAPQGWWHTVIGSGQNLCTALAAEREEPPYVTFVADFLPDYVLSGPDASWAHADHRPAMKFVEAANPAVMLALVKRIRELESDIEELYERARDDWWERDL